MSGNVGELELEDSTPESEVTSKPKATRRTKAGAKSVAKKSPAKKAAKKAPAKKAVAKKSPAKKVAKKATAKKAAKKAPAKATKRAKVSAGAAAESEVTVATSVGIDPVDTALAEAVGRKAPTPLDDEARLAKRRQRQRIIVAALVLLGIGSSAGVGFSDAGRIDIDKKIEERNQRIAANQATPEDLETGGQLIENRNNSTQVDGGLIGIQPTQLPPAPTATSTASSTATTTDASAVATSSEPVDPAVAGATDSAAPVDPAATDPIEPEAEGT